MTVVLTAQQPVYLPWLGLFHKIALADKFVSFNQVQYLPKDFNNRNKIKTSRGDIWLTVPVLKSGHRDKKFTQIEINNNTRWAEKHWKSLWINYSKSPYFKTYSDFFEDVYLNRKWAFLADLCEEMLRWFLDTLGIEVEFLDARHFKFQGFKSELVLDMCRQVGCDIYTFGKLGKNYADRQAFLSAGIEPYFQDYSHPEYPQLYGDFLPYMSIVDLLFNCGPDSLNILMDSNPTRADLKKMLEG